jgi:HAD superfamily hydrolase (TIGR01549 family)
MMTEQIEAVLFDLDHTLCEHQQSGAEVLARAFESEGVEPFFAIEDYRNRYNELVKTTNTTDLTDTTDITAVLRSECFAAIAEECGRDPALGRALAADYAAQRDYQDVHPLSGVCETVESLAHEYRLGIVTNGPPETQVTKLESIGLMDTFDVVICAGFDAPLKPAPEPFQQAVSELDTIPDAAVHVGDSLNSDVAGAQATDLQAVWLSDGIVPDPDPVPEYVIDSIAELTNLPWC